jgi:hypothetical protein
MNSLPCDRDTHHMICASLVQVQGSATEQLLGLRAPIDSFLARHDARAALLLTGGWLFQWLQGTPQALDKALAASQADTRHQHLRVVYRSQAPAVLTERLQIATTQTGEKPTDVARRLFQLQRSQEMERPASPQELWEHLSAPLRLASGDSGEARMLRRHVVAVTSGQTESVDLIRRLGDRFRAPLTYQRFATGEPGSSDVGAAYVDLAGRGQVTRLQALSRRSLVNPLLRMFLGQVHCVVLLLGPRPGPAQALALEVAQLLRSLELRPSLRLATLAADQAQMASEYLHDLSHDLVQIDPYALQQAKQDALLQLVLPAGARASGGCGLDLVLA